MPIAGSEEGWSQVATLFELNGVCHWQALSNSDALVSLVGQSEVFTHEVICPTAVILEAMQLRQDQKALS